MHHTVPNKDEKCHSKTFQTLYFYSQTSTVCSRRALFLLLGISFSSPEASISMALLKILPRTQRENMSFSAHVEPNCQVDMPLNILKEFYFWLRGHVSFLQHVLRWRNSRRLERCPIQTCSCFLNHSCCVVTLEWQIFFCLLLRKCFPKMLDSQTVVCLIRLWFGITGLESSGI